MGMRVDSARYNELSAGIDGLVRAFDYLIKMIANQRYFVIFNQNIGEIVVDGCYDIAFFDQGLHACGASKGTHHRDTESQRRKECSFSVSKCLCGSILSRTIIDLMQSRRKSRRCRHLLFKFARSFAIRVSFFHLSFSTRWAVRSWLSSM